MKFIFGVPDILPFFVGRSKTDQPNFSDSHHQPATAAAHHACHPTATNPAKPHEPATRHCAGPSSRNRERGLCSASCSVRDSGMGRKSSHCISKSLRVYACMLSRLFATSDCSPRGFPVHEILQVRILEWVVISYSRGSSRPRDWTHICIGRQVLYPCTTWEVSLERLIRSKMSSIVTF